MVKIFDVAWFVGVACLDAACLGPEHRDLEAMITGPGDEPRTEPAD